MRTIIFLCLCELALVVLHQHLHLLILLLHFRSVAMHQFCEGVFPFFQLLLQRQELCLCRLRHTHVVVRVKLKKFDTNLSFFEEGTPALQFGFSESPPTSSKVKEK